jgi:exopolysaccharide biosynthesis protein
MVFSVPGLPKFLTTALQTKMLLVLSLFLCGVAALAGYFWYLEKISAAQSTTQLSMQNSQLSLDLQLTEEQLSSISAQLTTLQSEDQFVRNEKLQAEIKAIVTTYQQTVASYERILDLRGDTTKTAPLEQKFSLVLTQLAQRKESSASATLESLQKDIADLQAALAVVSVPIPENLPVSNTPPVSGYSRQSVDTDVGTFAIDILTADLNSTRVQVETASDGDCRDNCPVATLADYVARSGGFAGINGPYFCPAEYPSCVGKTNSFDTLLMNKKKTYFNSDNNVYSSVPAIIFSGGGARLVGQSSEWGRDTGVDSVIASQPMLLSGGSITFGGDGDPKKGSRGSRSFIGAKDNQVYIGVVRNATVAEVSHVLKALGLQSALNLDSGGSTAFYVNGKYVAGPGRLTPFGIVLVRK